VTSSPIIVRLRDGTTMFTTAPVSQFTDRLLNARYNGASFTVNDQQVPLSEIAQVEWPKKDPE
jgi:hypothetical protein